MRHLIGDNNLNGLLNLNLIYEILWTGVSCLLISMLGKLSSFNWANNNGSLDLKMYGLFLRKDHLLRCWG